MAKINVKERAERLITILSKVNDPDEALYGLGSAISYLTILHENDYGDAADKTIIQKLASEIDKKLKYCESQMHAYASKQRADLDLYEQVFREKEYKIQEMTGIQADPNLSNNDKLENNKSSNDECTSIVAQCSSSVPKLRSSKRNKNKPKSMARPCSAPVSPP